MVRAYLLTPEQREAIKVYLRVRPRSMGQSMRALRHRSQQLDLEQMRRDVDLVERLATIPMSKGRKPKSSSLEVGAGFFVRREKKGTNPHSV